VKRFSEFVDGSEPSDTVEELEEGTLRNLGAAVLLSRVVSLSKQIKRSKDLDTKIDLLASQNSTVAAIVMTVGKFLEKSNR